MIPSLPAWSIYTAKRSSLESPHPSDLSDDIAITPCRTPALLSRVPSLALSHQPSRPITPKTEDSVSTHERQHNHFKELMYAPGPGKRGGPPDAETLWNRMLLVQMVCSAYNSARLNAAIETGEWERFMPPKQTLDMMNDMVNIRPEDVCRLKLAVDLKEKKLKKVMAPAWLVH